jgi:hypothetical protein
VSDRSERREEIKLILEYVKIAVSVLGISAVVFAALQWRVTNVVAKETIYERITNEWRDHLKTLVEKPELRPYFEDGKQLAAGDERPQAVLAYADVRLDVADAILTYAAIHGFYDEIEGWKRTFAHSFRMSSVLCARFQETRDNYGLLRAIADETCRSNR